MAREKKNTSSDEPRPDPFCSRCGQRSHDGKCEDRINAVNVAESLPEATVRKLCEGVLEPAKVKFLVNYALLGHRGKAAKATGVCTATTWMWRRDDDVFRQKYMDAQKIAAELHEDEMFRRASEGVLEPVFQGGEFVGSVRRYSDTLLMFGLKGAMPEKYRERVDMNHSGTVDHVTILRAARERALGRKK